MRSTKTRLGGPTTPEFRFGEFTLDPTGFQIARADRPVRLENLPMQLLILLVEHAGELVTREQIAERLWGKDVFVDVENGINTAVRKIRVALRDDPERPRFVETVVGKGYRFAAPVTCSGNGALTLAAGAAEPNGEVGAIPNSTSAECRPGVAVAPKNAIAKRRWFAVGAAVVVVLAAVLWLASRRNAAKPATPVAIKSIAVLPLKDLSGDATQEYLADGMTEALIGRLSAIHDLRVISRTSVMRFKDTQLSVPEIAKALRVDALVEGSVIRQGNRVRVTAQLIRGETDEHFWSESYDRDLQDMLALQSDVAQSIAKRVEATVTGRERERIVAANTVSPDAYDAYLKGRYALNNQGNTRAGVEQSLRYFEEAIEKDHSFAAAYVGVAAARTELGLVRNGGRPEDRRLVLEAAHKALQLDPDLSEAHLLLAHTAQQDWNWAAAEAEYGKALELDASDPDAYSGFAEWLACQGRLDEAVNWAERARDFDRLGTSGDTLAWVLFHAKRYDDAIRELRLALAMRPDNVQALWLLGFTFVVNGQPDAAIPLLEKAATVSRRSSGVLDVLSAAYARSGRRDDALRLVTELKQRSRSGYVSPTSFVIAYVGLGDKEQAFAWLEQGYNEKSNILQYVKVHPFLDPLRSDPRFADLVRRVGLKPGG